MTDIWTLLFAILLFMVFVGRRLIMDRLKKGKASFDGIKDRAMIDSAIERLEERFKGPFPVFEIPEGIMEILDREPGSEYAMNIFLQEVAAHCRYNRRKVMLRSFGRQEGMPPGRISKLGSSFLMELYLDSSESRDGILAVIVHEFCHFYLDEMGLELVDTIENEVLTDTAAIYFGFGDLMRRGYSPHVVATADGRGHLYRIGYLDTLNIDYVISRLGGRGR